MSILEEQQKFVEWLKSKGIYNPMESGHTMSEMFHVWKLMKEESNVKMET